MRVSGFSPVRCTPAIESMPPVSAAGSYRVRTTPGLISTASVCNEEPVDRQPDYFPRREVFAGCFVGEFGEAADQFLERQAHVRVRNYVRAANFCTA